MSESSQSANSSDSARPNCVFARLDVRIFAVRIPDIEGPIPVFSDVRGPKKVSSNLHKQQQNPGGEHNVLVMQQNTADFCGTVSEFAAMGDQPVEATSPGAREPDVVLQNHQAGEGDQTCNGLQEVTPNPVEKYQLPVLHLTAEDFGGVEFDFDAQSVGATIIGERGSNVVPQQQQSGTDKTEEQRQETPECFHGKSYGVGAHALDVYDEAMLRRKVVQSAEEMLRRWLRRNRYNPYPNQIELERLSRNTKLDGFTVQTLLGNLRKRYLLDMLKRDQKALNRYDLKQMAYIRSLTDRALRKQQTMWCGHTASAHYKRNHISSLSSVQVLNSGHMMRPMATMPRKQSCNREFASLIANSEPQQGHTHAASEVKLAARPLVIERLENARPKVIVEYMEQLYKCKEQEKFRDSGNKP